MLRITTRLGVTRQACRVALLLGLLGLLTAPRLVRADVPATRVVINGTPSPVFFNDGDSFRVLEGPYRGVKARLAGFNTLESHGPVHQWGTWTYKELYVVAKMATAHARNGQWSCTTDKKTDTYGRMLMWCPGLAASQVKHGFAHAMSVTDKPGKAMLLKAQREAQQQRRGIWAHGIPPFVVTSLHSAEEDTTGRGTYNRLVSSGDGHSIKWRHSDRYSECQKVCHKVFPTNPEQVKAIIDKLRLDDRAGDALSGVSDEILRQAVDFFAKYRVVDRPYPKKQRRALMELLTDYAKAGAFGPDQGQPASCMIHVVFERRFGGGKASCLK